MQSTPCIVATFGLIMEPMTLHDFPQSDLSQSPALQHVMIRACSPFKPSLITPTTDHCRSRVLVVSHYEQITASPDMIVMDSERHVNQTCQSCNQRSPSRSLH
ncbi:uncharacterized protein LOC122244249 [Penaeus japonicus]|uniref:uncharacterized protein LOC122244249 n=1 Tax=Penaeus japonicus TaxID=27405 RepID=UPI001C715B1D|nr:uncharacterized protein LOC122244249 [Penaeus japonicus]